MSAPELFLIEKRGLYYRPNAQGYTGLKSDAGRYSLEEAASRAGPNGPDGSQDGMEIWRESEAPEYSSACAWDVKMKREAYLAGHAAARADLCPAQAPAPRVKPLVWDDFDGMGAKASGFYQANYLITMWRGRGQFEVAMSYPGYQTGFDGERFHDTLEAAKAAAQDDYEARILAALTHPERPKS